MNSVLTENVIAINLDMIIAFSRIITPSCYLIIWLMIKAKNDVSTSNSAFENSSLGIYQLRK